MSKESDDNRKSVCSKTKEQLDAAYEAIVDEESIIPDCQAMQEFSRNEVRAIGEALAGDYKENYHNGKNDILQLPEFRSFQERLENSTFDAISMEFAGSKYRFLVPFIIKAELNPGLAFGEALLSLIHLLAFLSVLMNGFTAITMFVGSGSLFLLLSLVHFWYGHSRYPSIWNRFLPSDLKGSTLDRNFAEIREICAYYHNGYSKTNSQVFQFAITLPFTIIFHIISFVTTMAYYLLMSTKNEKIMRNLPEPGITSIFLSNALISSLWLLGATGGIIFAMLTIIFNQKAYDSLLFKKNLKDFCISLVFGNFVVVHQKLATGEKEIALSVRAIEHDIESGIAQVRTESKVGEKRQFLPSIRSLPSLLGASTSSSTNSLISQDEFSVINKKILNFHDDNVGIEVYKKSKSTPEVDEIISIKLNAEKVQNLNTLIPSSEDIEKKRPAKLFKKKFLSLSRLFFSNPRNKRNQNKKECFENQADDELSVEFLNPLDVHLDVENHLGTIEWRNAISESIQRFKIKSYTLRKHIWVMNQMHGKSFFIKGNGERRRKLKKRKEIKQYCKIFHDKQLEVNSQIYGILDDLKDLKKNHNNSKSNSDHTRNSLADMTTQVNKNGVTFKNMTPTVEERTSQEEKNRTISDYNNQIPKTGAASIAKESLVESSKESTISTLSQSIISEPPDEKAKRASICELYEEINEPLDKEVVMDDSSTFRDTISGLLNCASWIDNISVLRETGPIEKRDEVRRDIINLKYTPSKQNDAQNYTNEIKDEGQENRTKAKDGRSSSKPRPYWHNLVHENNMNETSGDFFPATDSPRGKRRKFYPWRSDLQKKKNEKAQANRSQSIEVGRKQTKRVISIWKKKKIKPVEVDGDLIYSPRRKEITDKVSEDDDRHEIVESRKWQDNRREMNSAPYEEKLDNIKKGHGHAQNRNSRINLRSSRNNDPEMNTSMFDKTSNTGCGRKYRFLQEDILDVCTPLEIEQREDVDFSPDDSFESKDQASSCEQMLMSL